MVTIYDIAKKAGFSPTTVSKALNDYPDISETTKGKIRKIAREMGYTPNSSARALATSKSWLIGVLFNEGEGLGIRHPHFSEIIEKFKGRMEASGYELIFIGSYIGSRSTTVFEHCRYRGVDAVFIANADFEEAYIHELVEGKIPCIASEYVSPKIPCVLTDNVQGAKKAVDYLYSLGHRKIAHIAAPIQTIAGEERYRAYKLSMESHGECPPEAYIQQANGFGFKHGYEAMQKLLDLPKPPTAIFCAIDVIACGAIAAARERGISVPEDISIIGFDDIELAAYLAPGLTTIRQDRTTIGQTCADILLKALDGEAVSPQDIRIPARLVIRNSCKRYTE